MFKDYPKRKDGTMVKIIKEELSLEESLKKKIEFICDFTNNKPTIIIPRTYFIPLSLELIIPYFYYIYKLSYSSKKL